jgi:hypothetical protein
MIVVETANIVLRQRGGDREGRLGRDTAPANVERDRIIAPRWQDRPTSDPRKAVLASKEASSRRRYKAIAPCML